MQAKLQFDPLVLAIISVGNRMSNNTGMSKELGCVMRASCIDVKAAYGSGWENAKGFQIGEITQSNSLRKPIKSLILFITKNKKLRTL